MLASSDGLDREELLAECRRIAALPQAVAAIDLALWDLAGRRAGSPVWRLLGAAAGEVEVNATIGSSDRAGAATEAAAARAAGFRCLKAKVAIGDDAGRLAAIRAAAGPDMEIRIDANGAWSVDEALASLRVLEPVGIELCEEPVAGLDAIARVSASTLVPIAIDETAGAPGALDRRALRRGLPQDRALRRHLRGDRGRPRGRGQWAMRSTSPPPTTARSGSPRPCTPPR